MYVERTSVTDKAKAVINELREKHGELMFHQSGGCCDGSAPMCFEKGDFLIGSRDDRKQANCSNQEKNLANVYLFLPDSIFKYIITLGRTNDQLLESVPSSVVGQLLPYTGGQ